MRSADTNRSNGLTKTERQIWIINQAGRGVWGDSKLLGKDAEVYGGPKQGGIGEEREERTCYEDGQLLARRPLERIIGIFGWDWK